MCVGAYRGQNSALPSLAMSCLMWLLGTKPESSAKAEGVPNC